MSDPEVPPAQPAEEDERLALKYQGVIEDTSLQGEPMAGQRCGSCLYYLSPDQELSYCWHPRLRMLVGADWWCQWWEQTPDET